MNLAEIMGLSLIPLLLPFLAVAIASDLTQHRIPNALALAMFCCGMALQLMVLGTSGLLDGAGGTLVGMSILFPFYAIGGMGAGDVKLLGAIGSFLGPFGALLAGMFALCIGGILGIIVLVWQAARVWAGHRRLAPFESSASSDAASGNGIGTPFAYSPAIAVGACIAAYQLCAPGIDSLIQSGCYKC